jgi:hypothetical protein
MSVDITWKSNRAEFNLRSYIEQTKWFVAERLAWFTGS